MSIPPALDSEPVLNDQALAAKAAELEILRSRIAAAQAGGGKADSALLMQFANAQRAFIAAKIQLEQVRKVQAEESKVAQIAAEAKAAAEAASAAAQAAATAQSSPATQTGGRLLTASRAFWLFMILSLTFLLWFLQSRFAGQ